jgi:hypothetical protein
MSITLSANQVEILAHSLGRDRSLESTRNYFCTGEGSSDWDDIRSLVDAGLMRETKTALSPDPFFTVTDIGKLALEEYLKIGKKR